MGPSTPTCRQRRQRSSSCIDVGPDNVPLEGVSDAMTIGASIFLIVVGTILYFAANVHVAGVSINTVGLILMIAGLAGLVLGLIQQAIWSRASR